MPRFDSLLIPELLVSQMPFLPVHPLVVKLDNRGVAPVVDRQRHLLALSLTEQARELQNVSDGRSSEPIKPLIVIAHNTEILSVVGQQGQNLFLHGIRVLIFVY